MTVSHVTDVFDNPLVEGLRQFIHKQRDQWTGGAPDFETFERELHTLLMALECDLVAAELGRYDVDAEAIAVRGVPYRQVLTSNETYQSAAGPVRVERRLYRAAGHNARSVCPLELRAGVIAGHWTPRAARLGAFVVAQVTAGEAESLFEEMGGMQPSRSALDRLPRDLSQRWETHRVEWEEALRSQETVPVGAATVALSVDGVMAPMKAEAGLRQAKRTEAGKHASGPAGYREVGCGTVSVYDREGERQQTIRTARMPERNKLAVQAQLQAELAAVLAVCPDLRLVLLADGAKPNWVLLQEIARALRVPSTTYFVIVDFFHACDHLKKGCDAIWNEGTPRGKAEFARLKTLLKEDEHGAERIRRVFKYQCTRLSGARRQRLQAELTFFHNQGPRMAYAEYQRHRLPIASGVVEAACKTLVTQRLKRSGMAWSPAGGQAILTLRSLIQSERWSHAWALLAADFRQPVTILTNTNYHALPLAA